MPFHWNICCTNSPQYYVIRALPASLCRRTYLFIITSLFRFLIFSHLLLPDCQRCLVVDDLFITILTLLLLCACNEICILCTVCLLLGCIKFVLLPRGTHKILTLCTIQRYHTEIEIKSKDRFLATLNTKRRLLYLKTQFVPRSKHFSSRL